MNKKLVIDFLRWIAVSVLLGAGTGIAIGLATDSMQKSLPLGVGIGMILGLTLVLQRHARK